MQISSATVTSQAVVYDAKAGGVSTKSSSLIYQKQNSYTQGTGNNQVTEQWNDQRTLAASGNETLDLNGTLKDDFGDTVAFTAIKEMIIENTSLTGSLAVGNTTTNGINFDVNYNTVTKIIPPGGKMHITNPLAGWTVTPGTADLLKIANQDSSNPLTYNIVLIGIG